jgi:sigma-B regulation protein RsbU (phosphoserine phosphatase)
MSRKPLTWQQELAIIDRTMKAISSISDPEELVEKYWQGVGELIEVGDFVALSRRNVEPPYYLVTRSSRFTEHFNPWTQRERLPKLSGGLLGEIAYANQPVFIDDLPSKLRPDDPAHFYLEGFASLVALPVYDGGEGLNVTVMLMPRELQFDRSRIPMMHWQAGLFGRGTTPFDNCFTSSVWLSPTWLTTLPSRNGCGAPAATVRCRCRLRRCRHHPLHENALNRFGLQRTLKA